MNWGRIQAVATPMELAPRSEEAEQPPRHEAATMVLTLAAFVLNVALAPPSTVRVPEVVRPMPAVNEAADCRIQNLEHPDLLARCDERETSSG